MADSTDQDHSVARPSGHTSASDVPPQMMGVPPEYTHAALQTDAFKELINKLSWVLGSTYRTPYSNTRTTARLYALRMAKRVIADQGYPRSIAKEGT